MVSIQIIKILRKEEKQMKKLLSLVLIGALALSLTACGNSDPKDKTTTSKIHKKSSDNRNNSGYSLIFSIPFSFFIVKEIPQASPLREKDAVAVAGLISVILVRRL